MLTNCMRRPSVLALILALAMAPAVTTTHASTRTLPAGETHAVPASSGGPEAPAPAEHAEATTDRMQDFTYLIRRPEQTASCTIVLLHGSGGDEASLMALASKVDPNAVLLGVRGRVRQAGVNRWYRRITPISFDQQDVRGEAEAFASFLSSKAEELGIDLDNAIFLGYSNGANLIGALTLLHPGLVHRAVLLRAMPVLDGAPDTPLADADILTIAGNTDVTYGPFAPQLEQLLASRGARVKAHMIEADHGIGDEDARLVREWLAVPQTQ